MDEPEKVAELAYKALMKGDRRIIGPAGKKNVLMATITPDNMVAKNMRKNMEPSDKDSEETRQEPMHKRSREVRTKSYLYNKGDKASAEKKNTGTKDPETGGAF
jgi:hypothetical protein